jgi:hypothetical protein
MTSTLDIITDYLHSEANCRVNDRWKLNYYGGCDYLGLDLHIIYKGNWESAILQIRNKLLEDGRHDILEHVEEYIEGDTKEEIIENFRERFFNEQYNDTMWVSDEWSTSKFDKVMDYLNDEADSSVDERWFLKYVDSNDSYYGLDLHTIYRGNWQSAILQIRENCLKSTEMVYKSFKKNKSRNSSIDIVKDACECLHDNLDKKETIKQFKKLFQDRKGVLYISKVV